MYINMTIGSFALYNIDVQTDMHSHIYQISCASFDLCFAPKDELFLGCLMDGHKDTLRLRASRLLSVIACAINHV